MASDVQHRILRISGVIIFMFVVLIGWQSYWQIFRSDWLMAQDTNRRVARAELNTPRGVIFDRRNTRLAWGQGGKREYADPVATAAVLGYIDPVRGRVGVEGAWDRELAGLSTSFDAREFNRLIKGEKPHGNDLVLTLDLRMQQAALRALDGKRGAVVMLDPETGGILAMATSPTFDLRQIRTNYDAITATGHGVLSNRAVQALYPPGSTMKVVTAAAALMHDVNPRTRYTCTGKTKYKGITITDYHGESHGTIAMSSALTHSCNYYFARTALALGQRDLQETAEAFGFDRSWVDKLADSRMLPVNQLSVSSLEPHPGRSIPMGELAQVGYGQATVVVTPLQMAMVSAAIANDGTVMAPYLVAQVRKGGAMTPLQTYQSVPIGYPMDKEHAGVLADMMRRVVTSGTGTRANIPGLTVYGKTGTAQQNGGDDHAWFIGFVEAERGETHKRVAFAVVIERGGTGGSVAVPVARQVLEAWQREL